MPAILLALALWCVLAAMFAGAHYRWIRYEVANPSPMDVLSALPPFVPKPGRVARGGRTASHASATGTLTIG